MRIGLGIVLGWTLITLFGPMLVPYSPAEQRLRDRLLPPSAGHWFGTDELGRDVFSRVVHGARLSLPTSLAVVTLTALLGTTIGVVAGFFGGVTDEVLMRVCDAVLAFPTLILAMAITAALGPGLFNAMLAIVLVLWPEYARLIRSQVLALREVEYILAAHAVGVATSGILWRHVLPNVLPALLVKVSLDIGNAILLAASLSFVGLGAVPPTPEWGAMVAAGRQKFFEWWIGTFPGLAILSVVVGFNFLGDGLRDWLDPRLR
jgi:peptide/nickel transport system permease protein